MKEKKIAVLITCYNRKEKTLSCLESLVNAYWPQNYSFKVFLVDDGSSDGTTEAVKKIFPKVNVITGSGNLFWAGGMRLAWNTALEYDKFDAYFLLNDDVKLSPDFLNGIQETERLAFEEHGKPGIYTSATYDEQNKKYTYGGAVILQNHFVMKAKRIEPTNKPQACDMTNANILWIDSTVVSKIGTFDNIYKHGIADYDYALTAKKNHIPVYLTPGFGGICVNDHGVTWESRNSTLKDRIKFLKSPKGLAYSEYLYYIKKHFPLFLPYSFTMLWLKTFFPFIWDKYKK